MLNPNLAMKMKNTTILVGKVIELFFARDIRV